MKNVIYAKYIPCTIGEICLMHGKTKFDDFVSSAIFGDVNAEDSEKYLKLYSEMESGKSIDMSIEETYRDGMYEDELFLIFEKKDIKKVIDLLNSLT